MQLGIFAKTFDGKSAASVLPQVNAAGFSLAQYNWACSGLSAMPDSIDNSVLNDVRHAIAASGVTLNAISATYNMIHPDVVVRNDGHRRLAVTAAAAQQLGIPLITLCTGTRDAVDQWKHHPDNSSIAAWRDLIASMQTALEIAEQFDVELGIEPELANVISSAQMAKQLIEEFKSPRLKIILDAANLFEAETITAQRHIVADAIEMLAPHIAMAHAKDRAADGTFVAAGKGVLDYPHYIRMLKETGFNGPLVTHGLTADEAAGVARFLLSQLSTPSTAGRKFY